MSTPEQMTISWENDAQTVPAAPLPAKRPRKPRAEKPAVAAVEVPVEEQPYALPENWRWVRLGGISFKVVDGSHNPPPKCENGYPILSAANIFNDNIDFSAVRFVDEAGFKLENDRTNIEVGDVLLTIVGSIGRSAVVPNDFSPFVLQRSVAVIKPKTNSYFLAQYFKSNHSQNYFFNNAKGTAQKGIYLNQLKQMVVPLPPLPEQARIVARLESLLGKIREARELIGDLKNSSRERRVQLIQTCVSGRQTTRWRSFLDNKKIDSASNLIESIYADRIRKNDKKDKVEKPFISHENISIQNWAKARLKDISICLDYMRKPVNKDERKKTPGRIPYYGANGQVDTVLNYIFDEDLVVVVEDETFVGRKSPFSYIIRGKTWVNNHAHVLRPLGGISVDFLNYLLSYYDFVPLTSGSTGRRKLTQKSMMEATVLVPPLEEQKEIVRILDHLLGLEDQALEQIENMEAELDTLEKAILSRAFRGELGTHDPSDAPVDLAALHP